eukprot:6047884-Pyramimonas_sp.AAC.1
MVKYPYTLYSDCLNVVRHSNLPSGDRLSGKRMYSGVTSEANARGGNRTSVVKVAAHKGLDEPGINTFE